MTEIGMALSNPLHGMRVPGAVGTPLPGVEVRLVDDAGKPVAPGTPGEIEVRGETVFSEYWRRPEDNRQAFRDGWFQTGDVAVFESGSYRILGRNSVDIIKTGGEKVSALEIESILLTYPAIRECAVVGIPDPIWGEKVCAALVPEAGQEPDVMMLRAWLKERLAPYKAPKEIAILRELPRNAMGKLIKAELKKFFQLSWGRGDDKSC
jgi:malonyl-CoA/methylmalonyl-CoA synthetase